MNKFTVAITLIIFWIFLPIGMTLGNLSGFLTVNTDGLNSISANDFNLLSLTGFKTMTNFLFELGKYTITNGVISNPIVASIFGTFTIISIVTVVWFLRGD